MASPSSDDTTDLFLIGKTGHGKSSTGNSILGREAFDVSDSTESDTYNIQVGWARRLGRQVKVVDGPGLAETRMGKGDAAKKMVRDMSEGIAQCPLGFHALLLVLKYGNRFTEEESKAIQMLKGIFGQSFVKDFCILVFTHGELFDMNSRKKNPKLSFEEWCRQQKGAIQSVFAECDYRAVLFYNLDETQSDAHLGRLFEMVDNLKSRGKRYTNDLFRNVEADREKLIVRENAPQLRESIQIKIDLLLDGLNKVKESTELDEETKSNVEELRQDARELDVEIVAQDKGTGVLKDLHQLVLNIQGNVDSHVDIMRATLDKREKEKALKDMQQKHEESVKQLKKEQNQRKRSWGSILGSIVLSHCHHIMSR